jgi:hypothetical protein
MSDWGNNSDDAKSNGTKTQKSNVTPFRRPSSSKSAAAKKDSASAKKKKEQNAKQVITPRVSFPENDTFLTHLDDICRNNGSAMHIIKHLLPENTLAINRATVVRREDGSVGFVELRLDVRPTGKTYRTLFLADVTGSDDPRNDGFGINSKVSALSALGLYTPSNPRELIAAQEYVARHPSLTLAIFWCEGEKARAAIEERLNCDIVRDWARAKNYYIITSATLGGTAGAEVTNYALRPRSGTPTQFIVENKNTTILRIEKAIHFIILDNDDAGRREGYTIAERFEKEYRVPKEQIHIVSPPETADEGWDDADDLPDGVTEQDRLDQILNAAYLTSESDRLRIIGAWPDADAKGNPQRTMRNALHALEILEHKIEYDTFSCTDLLDRKKLGTLALRSLRNEILERFQFDPGKENINDAAELLAERNQIHLVREYLDTLQWDGVHRLNKWLVTYLGAPDTKLNREISEIILVAGVRRVRRPGAKFDTMVVLEGSTGTGKSAALRTLADGGTATQGATSDDSCPSFFSDNSLVHLDEKKQMENLQGVWIQEVAELDGMSKADVNTIKTFLSRQSDKGRLAFERRADVQLRQCIFFGTTNEYQYLRDETGNRRFWPVKTTRIDQDALARDRDQLWAEACEIEKTGRTLVLAPELWGEATAEQDARRAVHPWLLILASISQNDCCRVTDPVTKIEYFTIPAKDIYQKILQLPAGQSTQNASRQVSSILVRELKWDSGREVIHNGKKVWGYRKKVSDWDFDASHTERPKTADDDDIPF